MTREDVIRNILSSYGKYGFTRELIEEQVSSGEANGFSYQSIYTGLRYAFSQITGEHEYFTVAEMAEAFGTTEKEMVNLIEQGRAEILVEGGKPDDYFVEQKPENIQKFIIPKGGLS